MESIDLSALGRDVQVSDFYNYYTDSILKSKNKYNNVFILFLLLQPFI